MAESVQYYLERMIPELEALEKKEVFSHTEIKSIIKKRTDFEYALQRRIKRKIDFLRAIEYEMTLEELRKKRIARLGIQDVFEKQLQYSGQRRIYNLFRRATIKFKHDISLWLQYIDYARQNNSNTVLSSVFVQAIQHHPTNASLWIMAANWEHEHNSNVAAARILLQRAIRLMPENQQLWLEYFKLELVYIEKIKLRRRILGIEQQKNQETEMATNADVDYDVDADGTINLPAVTGEDQEALQEDEAKSKKLTDQELNKLEENPILQGQLTKIVYDNAIQAIPDDIAFRMKFIEIYRQFSDTAAHIDHVYETIQNGIDNHDFKDATVTADACMYLAKRHLKDYTLSDPAFIPAFRQCVAEFETGLTATAESEVSSFLYSRYLQFLMGWHDVVSEPNFKLYLFKLIQKTFKRCKKEKKLSVELYEMWVKILKHNKQTDDDKSIDEVLEEALTAYPTSSAQLWLDRIALLPDTTSTNEKLQIYDTALKHIPDSLRLWTSYRDWIFTLQQQQVQNREEIDSIFEKACQQVTYLLPSVTEQNADRNAIKELIQCAYVEWAVSISENIEEARQVMRKVIKNYYPTYAFFKKCIELENQYGTGDKLGQANVESIFERMISMDNGDKEDAYLGYLAYLYSQKKLQKANRIYTRACNEVANKEAFDIQVQKIKQ